ncbi:MAG: hypothetical protein NTX59_14395 [Elusimicrobia bacterium]|nr:hypothetical protein [Elusimicrobiota bacterium]
MIKKVYPKAKYELRPSKLINGEVGLFSLVVFNKGDVVVEGSNWDESRLITWEEFETLDSATKRQLIYFCYKDDSGVHAPQNINKINIGYFGNHSCNPCLSHERDTNNYVAKRKIGVGEELSIDVEALMEKHIFSFKCKCGAGNCRGIINT